MESPSIAPNVSLLVEVQRCSKIAEPFLIPRPLPNADQSTYLFTPLAMDVVSGANGATNARVLRSDGGRVMLT